MNEVVSIEAFVLSSEQITCGVDQPFLIESMDIDLLTGTLIGITQADREKRPVPKSPYASFVSTDLIQRDYSVASTT